jgi:hypothetical protein
MATKVGRRAIGRALRGVKWLVPVLSLALLPAAATGCAKKALETTDGSGGIGPIGPGADGGGDGGATDVGGTADGGGGAIDGSWDLPVSAVRSYVVTSQVSANGAEVTAHSFTLTFDFGQHTAIIGTSGSGQVTPVEQIAPGVLRVAQVLAFAVPVQAACGGSVRYEDLTFTFEPAGILSGSGAGALTANPGAFSTTAAATMTLTGVPDIESPGLSLSSSGDPADPWASLWVVASEPLPGGQTLPVLRSADGDVFAFASATGTDPFFTILEKPRLMLAFGETYRISFDGITDFAGNPAGWIGDPTFTTRPAPPFVLPDGFESVTDDTLGGALILSGAGTPTISGARSLYVPPAAALAASGFVTQLALRLPVSLTSTTLKFTYRFVNPGNTSGLYFVIASVGGSIETVSLASPPGATTPATIGQDQVVLGPTATAAIALPPDARDEIVFARIASQSSSCGGPAPAPVPGIIIDDLRVP